MTWLVFKYLVTSTLIVVASEAARAGHRWAALLTALPLITILTLIWMQSEGAEESRIAQYSIDTFWFVLPTLPMFMVFAVLLPRLGFWLALLVSMILSTGLFLLLRHFLPE